MQSEVKKIFMLIKKNLYDRETKSPFQFSPRLIIHKQAIKFIIMKKKFQEKKNYNK